MKIEIDVEEFAAQLKAGKGIGDKDGALTPLIKQLVLPFWWFFKVAE